MLLKQVNELLSYGRCATAQKITSEHKKVWGEHERPDGLCFLVLTLANQSNFKDKRSNIYIHKSNVIVLDGSRVVVDGKLFLRAGSDIFSAAAAFISSFLNAPALRTHGEKTDWIMRVWKRWAGISPPLCANKWVLLKIYWRWCWPYFKRNLRATTAKLPSARSLLLIYA